MDTVIVSPSFQIGIPPTIRETLRLQPRHQVQIIMYDNRIGRIPVQPTQTMRGFLEGLNTTIEREEDRICMVWILMVKDFLCAFAVRSFKRRERHFHQ